MKKIKFSDFIIFEDEDYVLVNKPAHFATLADRNDKTNIINSRIQMKLNIFLGVLPVIILKST